MTPQQQARCVAYTQLMEEHCTTRGADNSFLRHDYMMAIHYIEQGNPEHARYHVIHAGVPRDLVLAVDALVSG